MTNAKKALTAGIAGTGFIGPVHIEGLRRAGIRIHGLSEFSPELAASKAAELGIEKAYGSFDEMIADPAIDVVHIATPNFLHFPQAKAALLAGKHVVCEKPLAMNSAEASELVKLAAKTGLVAAVNYNLRFYPLIHQCREFVAGGELGNLFTIHGSYLQDWLLYETDWSWRLESGKGGSTRAVADIGSHWIDMVSFITGLKIEEVCADFSTVHKTRKRPLGQVDSFAGKTEKRIETVDEPINTEDFAGILLRFSNGARGSLTVSQISAGRKNRLYFEIDGSKASAAWDSEHPNDLWLGHRERANETLMKDPSLLSPSVRKLSSYPGGHQEGYGDTFKQLFTAVYRYIAKGDFKAKPDFPTVADGYYEMRLIEAIEKSARRNGWVKVEEAQQ
jgi:predicted dehydrogenase